MVSPVYLLKYAYLKLYKHVSVEYLQSYGPPHDKTNKMACSEDSDQLGQPPSQSLRCVLSGKLKTPRFLQVDSEDSDQSAWMPRLI